MRGAFQWRRGLVLAGIHLAISVPLILMEESRIWDWVHSQENWRPHPAPEVQPDEGETVTFNPCAMWYHLSFPQRIIVMGKLPAAGALITICTGTGILASSCWTDFHLGIKPKESSYTLSGRTLPFD
jgi:hypothetical protein